MVDLQDAIKKKFRIHKGKDNLPILAMSQKSPRKKGRVMLAELMGEVGLTNGVEIGTRSGGSAILWCKYNPNLILTCVDPWVKYYHERSQEKQDIVFKRAINNLSSYNVKIRRIPSFEALKEFKDESIDFVHIDGNHRFDYCCSDIIFWSQKVKRGGLILIHDYCAFNQNGVMEAVNAYTRCHNINPWYVTRSKSPTAFWVK